MASITNKADPLPKLRVTRLSCKDVFAQLAQRVSTEVDGDDEELAGETNFGDGLRGRDVAGVGMGQEFVSSGFDAFDDFFLTTQLVSVILYDQNKVIWVDRTILHQLKIVCLWLNCSCMPF